MTRIPRAAILALVATTALVLGACGDDSDGDGDEGASGEAGVCEARADLTESFAALGDIDVVADGTDALRDAIDQIGDDLAELREAAGDQASDEIDAVEAANDELSTAVGDLGDDEPIGEATGAVASALGDLSLALGDLVLAFGQDCDES